MSNVSASTPLLGNQATSRRPGGPILRNVYLDNAALVAQIGVFALVLVVWIPVLSSKIILFSGHPLAQSLAVLVLTQSVLALQPTHDAPQKKAGQRAHAILNLLAFLLLVAGVVIIEYNKIRGNGPHFHSVHGYLGVITSIIILVQYFVGFTMWAVPALYGGIDNAKAVWKYHRASGYTVYLSLLATVLSAVWTDYNNFVLGIQWWMMAVPIALILTMLLRVHLYKFGFGTGSPTSVMETGSP